jgi:3'-5' exoribonuclease
MKTLFVKDLKKDIQLDGELFSINKFQKNLTKSGDEYYRIEIGDRTGTIVGNMWKDNISNLDQEALVVGEVAKVFAKVEEYKGSLQLNYYSIGKAAEYNMADFMAVSKRDFESMEAAFQSHMKSITDSDYKSLIDKLFGNESIKSLLFQHPAAEKLHHSYKHGLLEHLLEILDLSDVVIKYYPNVDIDLIKTGILFHDIGKLFELSQEGTTFVRTLEGKLIGHIAQGYEFLIKLLDEDFPKEKAIKLKHVLLSHHGSLEFGSPIVPKTIEAAIVSSLDDVSAQIRNFDKILDENVDNQNDFSNFDSLLKREVYLK